MKEHSMNTLTTLPLPVTVGEARSALREALNARGIAIFAEWDQTREAFNDLLTIPASVVFSFAPRMPLWRILRAAPALGAELPLKIQLWQDKNLDNWLTHTNLPALAAAHGAQTLLEDADFLQLCQLMEEVLALITQLSSHPAAHACPTPADA